MHCAGHRPSAVRPTASQTPLRKTGLVRLVIVLLRAASGAVRHAFFRTSAPVTARLRPPSAAMQKANAERAVPEAAAPAKRPRIDSASPLPASVAAGGFLATCSDLVQLILSLIPRRPRLLVASLVCKRWRAAALRTVTHTHMRSRDSVRAFDLLPNLTSISFSPGFLMSASAPARITHLSIKPPVGPTDLLDAAPLASLTRLTSIKLYVSTSTPKLIALLATHASTIQSLRLTVFDLAPANQLPLLPQLRVSRPSGARDRPRTRYRDATSLPPH